MSDLELAVMDRLTMPSVGRPERHALKRLRTLLSEWRRDRTLRCETRAIIVLERRGLAQGVEPAFRHHGLP